MDKFLGPTGGPRVPKSRSCWTNFRPNETYFISIIDYMVYVKMTEASHHNCIRPYSYYSQQLPPLGTALAFLHRMEHLVTSERVDQPLSGWWLQLKHRVWNGPTTLIYCCLFDLVCMFGPIEHDTTALFHAVSIYITHPLLEIVLNHTPSRHWQWLRMRSPGLGDGNSPLCRFVSCAEFPSHQGLLVLSREWMGMGQ